MTSNYKIKNEGGTYLGEENILVTEIEMDQPKNPNNIIFRFSAAPSDPSFWESFNTISNF